MTDYYEIDFLDVESDKSGDAITMRYEIDGEQRIHVVDAGFQATGDSVVKHIRKYYDEPDRIDAVVATHPDGDHAGGLRSVLESFAVSGIWMHRPWLYCEELLHRFPSIETPNGLRRVLRKAYPNIVALETIADEKGIPIHEAFQGTRVGAFTILAPNRSLYLDYVCESNKTPESEESSKGTFSDAFASKFMQVYTAAVKLVKAAWGIETFPEGDTSPDNNMSIVQYADICNHNILLTADAGRTTLSDAADYAPHVGLVLPCKVNRMQVPHHGSRHNVSTELLDRWLGKPLETQPAYGGGTFTAIVSSAKKDKAHPRKSVVRAFMHRGANFVATEGRSIRVARNAPERDWTTVGKVR